MDAILLEGGKNEADPFDSKEYDPIDLDNKQMSADYDAVKVYCNQNTSEGTLECINNVGNLSKFERILMK